MVPGYRLMQGRIDIVNRVLREQTSGIRVLRAFVREPFETERFARANAELTDVSLSVGRWMAADVPGGAARPQRVKRGRSSGSARSGSRPARWRSER